MVKIQTCSFLYHVRFFRYFGLLPFVLGPPSYSRFSKYFLPFALALTAVISADFGNRVIITLSEEVGKFERIVVLMIYLSLTAHPILILVGTFRKRFVFESVMSQCVDLQEKLNAKNYQLFVPIKLGVLFGIFFMTLAWITISSGFLCSRISVLLMVITGIFSTISHVHQFACLLLFSYFAYSVGYLFERLADDLADDELKNRSEFVRKYDRLAGLFANVNDCFSYLVSMCLLASFAQFLAGIYIFLTFVTGPTVTCGVSVMYVWLFGFVATSFSVLVHSCQTASDQANKCHMAFFNQLIDSDRTVSYRQDPYILMHFINNRTRLVFKAFNSIPINIRLAHSMTAAVMTYAIITLQIQTSPKNQN
ncbi:Hypothetical protein NTJ_14484 [Nesidiocoris tenuis]|uniref:Gustatory receptor n=1 Tax=Nesidiocoris tenuis TaxID=355587 RepID=A0ABN7BBA2_9HEMI|nr:Hypothetical protein NTJ_14484 [Nesidiocoris tenuis]